MDIIKQGGYNTGRMYGPYGQRVYFWIMADNTVDFYDLDRMIIGRINRKYDDGGAIAHWVQAQYDRNDYYMSCQPAPVPEGFDFGAKLRI